MRASLDGHLFFNIAGIGLDARVAHRFAQGGLERRGFVRYLELAAREIASFTPHEYALTADGRDLTGATPADCDRQRTAVRQWRVDRALRRSSTTANSISWWWTTCQRGRVLMHAPKLFAGTVARVPGVSITKTQAAGNRVRRGARVSRRWRAACRWTVRQRARVHARALRVMSAIR